VKENTKNVEKKKEKQNVKTDNCLKDNALKMLFKIQKTILEGKIDGLNE